MGEKEAEKFIRDTFKSLGATKRDVQEASDLLNGDSLTRALDGRLFTSASFDLSKLEPQWRVMIWGLLKQVVIMQAAFQDVVPDAEEAVGIHDSAAEKCNDDKVYAGIKAMAAYFLMRQTSVREINQVILEEIDSTENWEAN